MLFKHSTYIIKESGYLNFTEAYIPPKTVFWGNHSVPSKRWSPCYFRYSFFNAIPLCALIPLDYRIWRLNFCNNQPIFSLPRLKTQPSSDLQKSVLSLALTSFSGLIQVLQSLQRLTFRAYGVSKRRLTISVTWAVNFNDLSSSSCTCSLPLEKARCKIWKTSFKTYE